MLMLISLLIVLTVEKTKKEITCTVLTLKCRSECAIEIQDCKHRFPTLSVQLLHCLLKYLVVKI